MLLTEAIFSILAISIIGYILLIMYEVDYMKPAPPQPKEEPKPKLKPEMAPVVISILLPGTVPGVAPGVVPVRLPEVVPEAVPIAVPEPVPEAVPEAMPEAVPQKLEPALSPVQSKMVRRNFLLEEAALALGGTLELSEKEVAVNECLMKHKANDVKVCNSTNFWRQHYSTYKNKIKHSKVYQMIRDIPKGAVLHIHDMGILNADYLLKLTYLDNLYACFPQHDVRFRFSKKFPKDGMDWDPVTYLRSSSPSKAEFDLFLKKHLTFVIASPDKIYPTTEDSWKALMKFYRTVESLLCYRPIWEQYIYDALKALRNDRIMYVEIRTIFPNLYDLDGTVYPPSITAKCYKDIISKFVAEHPSSFIGVKLIYTPLRHIDRKSLDEKLAFARQLQAEIPDHFAGFDLYGQEDTGGSLQEFFISLNKSKDLTFFFHAGEINDYGNEADENLVDAVLLGTKRIGGAFSLSKHPLLIKEVIDRGIAVEVNVISNYMLALVRDLRNHPLSVLLANGVPVVLSSDHPGAWDAELLSLDFYVAFIAIAHQKADLRMLKTLAMNSIKYSAMTEIEKKKAFWMYNRQWETYLSKFDAAKYEK